MKWKANANTYLNGQTRLTKSFAWLPVYINGYMLWLAFYDTLKAYTVTITKTDLGVFENGKWVIVSKRIKTVK